MPSQRHTPQEIDFGSVLSVCLGCYHNEPCTQAERKNVLTNDGHACYSLLTMHAASQSAKVVLPRI